MFLTSLYNQGKGYSCINLARSAVATLLFGSKISVSMHPLVKNLLEECLTEDQHSHGTQLRGTHILFKFLKWSPAANLSLPQLTLKVVLLCLLLSARGVRPYGCWIYATLLGQRQTFDVHLNLSPQDFRSKQTSGRTCVWKLS